MAKAARRNALRLLTAPVDGVVQQLAVRTTGGVVTPAQELMRIVPADAALEIEAEVLNRDIGFVAEGQRAEVKVETYPFTRHGMLDATVVSVSRDSVSPSAASEANMQASTGTAGEGPSVYRAHLSIDGGTLALDGAPALLAPGMTVTVEIKTGTRAVIDFLLAPLLRHGQESLRER